MDPGWWNAWTQHIVLFSRLHSDVKWLVSPAETLHTCQYHLWAFKFIQPWLWIRTGTKGPSAQVPSISSGRNHLVLIPLRDNLHPPLLRGPMLPIREMCSPQGLHATPRYPTKLGFQDDMIQSSGYETDTTGMPHLKSTFSRSGVEVLIEGHTCKVHWQASGFSNPSS